MKTYPSSFFTAPGAPARGEKIEKKKEEGLDMREEGRGGASQWGEEEKKLFYNFLLNNK